MVLNNSISLYSFLFLTFWYYRLCLLFAVLTQILAFKNKIDLPRKLDLQDYEDYNWREWLGENLVWCSEEPHTSGFWTNRRDFKYNCSSSFVFISPEAKYLACPLRPSVWGDQQLNISYDSNSYTVEVSEFPSDTVWRYQFSVNNKNLESVKVSIGKLTEIF